MLAAWSRDEGWTEGEKPAEGESTGLWGLTFFLMLGGNPGLLTLWSLLRAGSGTPSPGLHGAFQTPPLLPLPPTGQNPRRHLSLLQCPFPASWIQRAAKSNGPAPAVSR